MHDWLVWLKFMKFSFEGVLGKLHGRQSSSAHLEEHSTSALRSITIVHVIDGERTGAHGL